MRALASCDGNVAQAAELLGITRPTLYGLMAKIGVK
jgi:two-component system NtrC family response regulator